MDTLLLDWQQVRNQLEQKKAAIYEEIANYPPPIPACDQQFNHLLEERTQILQELKKLEAVTKQNAENSSAKAIHTFITESAFLNDSRYK